MKNKSEIFKLAHAVAKYSYKNNTGVEAQSIYNNIFRLSIPKTYKEKFLKALAYIRKSEKSENNNRGKVESVATVKKATYKQFNYLNNLGFYFPESIKNFKDFENTYTTLQASQIINDCLNGFVKA